MYCISVSHRKAPANIRERYALSKTEREDFITKMMTEKKVDGCVILCTCNRSEIYFSKFSEQVRDRFDQMITSFAGLKKVDAEELRKYLNFFEGGKAITHLFKVCSGFDSKILGEDEILRQVKDSYEESLECHGTNYEINEIFQKALTCAKRIKTDTEISRVPVSVTTLAANEVFHFQKEGMKKVLLLGLTGKIGGDIAKNLICKSNVHILGTVRSHNTTIEQTLRHERLEIISYSNRYQYVDEADVIISATSSPHFTLLTEEVRENITCVKPRLFLDLAMPRDIEPTMDQIPMSELKNIDYFDTLSVTNAAHKLEEADRAKAILEEEQEELLKDLAFHQFMNQIPEWKALLKDLSLEKVLYLCKKNLHLEQMQTILEALNQLEDWVK